MASNRLYNYLVNNYGLSKEKVMKIMEKRFEKLELDVKIMSEGKVKNTIHNEVKNFIESVDFYNFVENKLLNILEHGFKPEHWTKKRLSMEAFIKNRVSELIQQEVERQWREKMNPPEKSDES